MMIHILHTEASARELGWKYGLMRNDIIGRREWRPPRNGDGDEGDVP